MEACCWVFTECFDGFQVPNNITQNAGQTQILTNGGTYLIQQSVDNEHTIVTRQSPQTVAAVSCFAYFFFVIIPPSAFPYCEWDGSGVGDVK